VSGTLVLQVGVGGSVGTGPGVQVPGVAVAIGVAVGCGVGQVPLSGSVMSAGEGVTVLLVPITTEVEVL